MVVISPVPFNTAFQGRHYPLLKHALPPWLKSTSLARLHALRAVGLKDPAPYPHATPDQHAGLKQAIADHWDTLNTLDQRLQKLNDVYAYAERVLGSALLADYGPIDVRNTFLRVYVKATSAWWVHDFKQAVTSRTVSLLDAALHNFAASERFVDYAFLSAADARGQQRSLTFKHKANGTALTAERFKQLCRGLDIGRHYREHLKIVMGVYTPTVARDLRRQVIDQHKAGLKAAAHLALVKGDIAQDACTAVLGLINRNSTLRLDGQTLAAHTLDMMNSRLTGILLFCATPPSAARVIAYVPDDPEHPLKQYPTPIAFMTQVTRQLRDAEHYQVFFSRFVDHDQRGFFFANLNTRLSRVQWRIKAPTDSQPTWQDTPLDNPHLQFHVQPIAADHPNRASNGGADDLWHYRYRVHLNKVLNDAQDIAVSTLRADTLARQAWWDNLGKILGDLFNAALQVLTPFVPGLGEVMLAYTAYQITDEVFEGVVDWAQGRGAEAADHLLGVAQEFVQFGLFAAGTTLAAPLRLKLSAFVEGLKPVQSADGRQRLWNPDLAPYVDDQGTLDPAQRLIHEGAQYRVQHARIVHPRRPQAYRPQLSRRANGIVVHEADQPQTWDSRTLMRRLGPRVEAFSDEQLERIRLTSGCDDDVLRGAYLQDQPLPPLLADTLNRFEAYASAQSASDQIRTGMPLDPAAAWFEQTVTELEGWPQDKALEVFLSPSLSGDSHRYGRLDVAPADTLKMSVAQVMSGQLPERVLGFLDEAQARLLLGAQVPKAGQVQHLRELLAAYVTRQAPEIGQYAHHVRELSDEPGIRLLREHFRQMDSSVARSLLDGADADERSLMLDHRRLPLRLENLARELNFAAGTSHAYESFYFPWRQTADSERMLLNTLKRHSDFFADLHLQIRQHTADGPLRCEAGPVNAGTRRILVRKDTLGYEVRDGAHRKLHGPDTLYEALLHAAPADSRQAVGLSPGQGEGLRHWLLTTLEPLAERRSALAQPPVRSQADEETLKLLGSPAPARTPKLVVMSEQVVILNALKTVFTHQSEAHILAFMEKVGSEHLSPRVNQLIVDHYRLDADLAHWSRQPGNHPPDRELELRLFIRGKLLECWQDQIRAYTEPSGTRLDLSGITLPDTLPPLRADFSHVTRLNLIHSQFNADHGEFLQHFPQLSTLYLADNPLSRLPEAIRDLRHLENLDLAWCPLALQAVDVTRLKNLRYLRRLKLNNNRSHRAPDIGRMRDLVHLDLSHSPVAQWPDGLFEVPRSSRFVLNLQGTAITHVPEVALGSAEAQLVAATYLNRAALDALQRERFKAYRASVGLDPERTYEPQGDSTPWLDYLSPQGQDDARKVWDALEHEHGSQGLFEVIKALEIPERFQTDEDQQRYRANHRTLTRQVWTLLQAAAVDTPLRNRLFEIASFPGNCPDAGTQIFNEMGVEVLLYQIEHQAPTPEAHERQLVTLVKGRARLQQLNDVIRADVQQRLAPVAQGGQGLRFLTEVVDGVAGQVDEVEIYLAYQTALAERLDLPWIAEHMLYRSIAGVSDAQIDAAYAKVLELGEGDGLVNRMLLDAHWCEWLERRYAAQYAEQQQWLKAQHNRLFDLLELGEQWPQTPDTAALQTQVDALASELGMSGLNPADPAAFQAACEKREEELGDIAQAWMRDRTRAALMAARTLRNRPSR